MRKKLTLINTVASVVAPLNEIAKELLPDIEITHVVDESILKDLIAAGKLSPETNRRVSELIIAAERSGADAVLVTCSSISPCVDMAKQLVNIPVLKIDEPMAEEAVMTGKKIGVAATLNTTLGPTISLIESKARQHNKSIEITRCLCEGAFDAAISGDGETHDRIVLEKLRQLANETDVIVLAQASMARLLPSLGPEMTTAILSSPRSGIKRAGEVLR